MSRSEIWLIDDDASIRFVLTEALTDSGYKVRSFESSQAALIALNEDELPSLLFTDIRMPGGSGLDFLETVKQTPSTAILLPNFKSSNSAEGLIVKVFFVF